MAPLLVALQPAEYFETREVSVERALVVIALVVIVTGLSILPIGWLFVTSFDPSTTVPNPDKPSESLCGEEGIGNMSVGSENITFQTPEECTEPAQIGIRSVIWRFTGQLAFEQAISVVIGWLAITVALYGLASSAFESGRDAIVIASWGTVPWAVGALITAGILVIRVDTAAFPAADLSAAETVDALVPQFKASRPITAGIQAVTTAWTGWIHYHGLRVRTSLTARKAFELAAVVNASGYLVVVLGTLISI
ncbi:MAG: hypothetical protein SVG88_02195 [Halobacteriales archaeon]|nr:hypothetical protein [Halobacteriales archaeon]